MCVREEGAADPASALPPLSPHLSQLRLEIKVEFSFRVRIINDDLHRYVNTMSCIWTTSGEWFISTLPCSTARATGRPRPSVRRRRRRYVGFGCLSAPAVQTADPPVRHVRQSSIHFLISNHSTDRSTRETSSTTAWLPHRICPFPLLSTNGPPRWSRQMPPASSMSTAPAATSHGPPNPSSK